MKTISIKYNFKLDENRNEEFDIILDSKSLEIIDNIPDSLPYWTDLNYYQCHHCTLDTNKNSYCPVVANLVNIVGKFHNILSFEDINLEIVTYERCIFQQTTAQRAISSLMGLVIATSGCPHSVYFKPMARFHLPLANDEETIYRATSMYLLAQYFVNNKTGIADFDLKGLEKIYNNMHDVNKAIANRLRAATSTDSSLNALVMLDMFTLDVPLVIKASLNEINYLFQPYLSDVEVEEVEQINITL